MISNSIKDNGRNINIVKELWGSMLSLQKLPNPFSMKKNICRFENSDSLTEKISAIHENKGVIYQISNFCEIYKKIVDP